MTNMMSRWHSSLSLVKNKKTRRFGHRVPSFARLFNLKGVVTWEGHPLPTHLPTQNPKQNLSIWKQGELNPYWKRV